MWKLIKRVWAAIRHFLSVRSLLDVLRLKDYVVGVIIGIGLGLWSYVKQLPALMIAVIALLVTGFVLFVIAIGKTGTGKSTLIANLARQDAFKGEGFALLDPHEDLVEQVSRSVPEERQRDLVYFNVSDTAHPIAFNPLEVTRGGFRPLAASGLISVFKKIWAEFWGPRMEYVLSNTLLELLELSTAQACFGENTFLIVSAPNPSRNTATRAGNTSSFAS